MIRNICLCLLVFSSVTFAPCLSAAEKQSQSLYHAQGEMVGEVTTSTALLQSRLTKTPGPTLDKDGDIAGVEGVASFQWSESDSFENPQQTVWLKAETAHDYLVRAKLTGLKPGQVYYYRLIYGPDEKQTQQGPTRKFKTLLKPDSTDKLHFCMGSCMNYAFFLHGRNAGGRESLASDQDKQLGYPSFAAMLKLQPDFFIGTGDIVYYDHPAKTAAKTLPEIRKKWHEQFRFPRLVAFFAQTPAYWSKDDHDFRFNDADLAGDRLPEADTGIEIFREQMPIHAAGENNLPTYRTHRVHKHLQLWFTEGRDYRSPNKMEDGPNKTLWGAEQREWLKRTLKESDATWKVIITPTPMVGPDSARKKDNHTNLSGFRHEANAFFEWLREQELTNVMTFCGDRHWQYHSIHPLGLEEFSVGALNDENAISGVRPGSMNSTDPEGLIKQPYIYPKATGGFLHVTVDENASRTAKLKIEFYDDTGEQLHSVTKTAEKNNDASSFSD